jgi:hypothetical protein
MGIDSTHYDRPAYCSKMDKETDIKQTDLSSDHDVQMGNFVVDPIREKRLLWKLDLCICPLVMLIFLVAYLDRSNLG